MMTDKAESHAHDLRATAMRLYKDSEDRKRLQQIRSNLQEEQKAAFNHLSHRVINVYLLEFLIMNVMQVDLREVQLNFSSHLKADIITIAVGDERVEIRPMLDIVRPERVHAVMKNLGNGTEFFFDCDLTRSHTEWRTVIPETGIRKLIERHLPERSATLDEEMFRMVLNKALIGPQAILNFGRDEINRGLSHLLDFITSDEVRRSLAIGVRRSASLVAGQVSLAAPVVKNATIKALPRLNKPILLLPDMTSENRKTPEEPS